MIESKTKSNQPQGLMRCVLFLCGCFIILNIINFKPKGLLIFNNSTDLLFMCKPLFKINSLILNNLIFMKNNCKKVEII
jgi:hypothetical protein